MSIRFRTRHASGGVLFFLCYMFASALVYSAVLVSKALLFVARALYMAWQRHKSAKEKRDNMSYAAGQILLKRAGKI
jgi:hypothetical protein